MSNDDYLDSLERVKGKIIGNMSRKQNGFEDCCKEFQFIRPFDTFILKNL